MAECNTCGGYLSIEDKIRLSMKCDANGNVVWQGALLNQTEPEVEAYITGLTTPLSSTQIGKLNTFVAALKTGLGISALSDAFDVMYILAGETAESSLKNLIKNAHHGTAVNSPDFTQFEGFTGNGTSSYIDINYNQSADAVNAILNSTSIGIYLRNKQAYSCFGVRQTTPAAFSFIYPNRVGNETYYFPINTDNAEISHPFNGVGMYVASRTTNNVLYGYTNKIKSELKTYISSSIPNLDYVILARNFDNIIRPTLHQASFAFVGRGLSDTDISFITDAIEAYMDSNGKGVIA